MSQKRSSMLVLLFFAIHSESSFTSELYSSDLPGSLHRFRCVLRSGPSRQLGHLSSSRPWMRAMFRRVAHMPIVCLDNHTPYMSGFFDRTSRSDSQSTESNFSGDQPNPPMLESARRRTGQMKNFRASALPNENLIAVATSVVCFITSTMTAACSRGSN